LDQTEGLRVDQGSEEDEASPTIADLMGKVKKLRDSAEYYEDLAKRRAAEADESARTLMDLMVAQGLAACRHGSLRAELRDARSYAHCMHVNRATGVDMRGAVAALKLAGLGDLVSEQYSSASLKARLREGIENLPIGASLEDLMPDALRNAFKVFEEKKVVVVGKLTENAPDVPGHENE